MSKPSKEKYREFWINYYDKHDVYDSYGVCHKNQTHADKNKMKDRVELIHVIEYSAYQKQTEVIEVLWSALVLIGSKSIPGWDVASFANETLDKAKELMGEDAPASSDLETGD